MTKDLEQRIDRLDYLLILARAQIKDLRQLLQDPKAILREVSDKEKLLRSKVDEILGGLVELENLKRNGRCD